MMEINPSIICISIDGNFFSRKLISDKKISDYHEFPWFIHIFNFDYSSWINRLFLFFQNYILGPFYFHFEQRGRQVHKIQKKYTNGRDQLLIDDYRFYKNPVTKEEGESAKLANFLGFTRLVGASKRNILIGIDDLNHLPKVKDPKFHEQFIN